MFYNVIAEKTYKNTEEVANHGKQITLNKISWLEKRIFST